MKTYEILFENQSYDALELHQYPCFRVHVGSIERSLLSNENLHGFQVDDSLFNAIIIQSRNRHGGPIRTRGTFENLPNSLIDLRSCPVLYNSTHIHLNQLCSIFHSNSHHILENTHLKVTYN